MTDILYRRATLTDYPVLMRFIDDVFFPGNAGWFREYLPNLYSDPLIATREAYLACDGERIIGHIGVYPLSLRTAGNLELLAGGIGAVATDPEYRHRGIMSTMLRLAIDGMGASAYDLSVLWGDRRRYLPSGWESVGRILEWEFDPRIAQAAGASPVPLVAFNPERGIESLVHSWNSDTTGTLHDCESMRALMTRKQWRTAIPANAQPGSPLPFVTYQPSDKNIVVSKLVGPVDLLPGILLSLLELEDRKPARLIVHCPAMPHPVAELGIKMNSSLTMRTACQARIINRRSLASKLRIDSSTLPTDSCEAVRRLFGMPADTVGEVFPLWIETPAYV